MTKAGKRKSGDQEDQELEEKMKGKGVADLKEMLREMNAQNKRLKESAEQDAKLLLSQRLAVFARVNKVKQEKRRVEVESKAKANKDEAEARIREIDQRLAARKQAQPTNFGGFLAAGHAANMLQPLQQQQHGLLALAQDGLPADPSWAVFADGDLDTIFSDIPPLE